MAKAGVAMVTSGALEVSDLEEFGEMNLQAVRRRRSHVARLHLRFVREGSPPIPQAIDKASVEPSPSAL